MREPFIRNHEYNFIHKQADYVLHTLRTVGDPKVVASVRSNAQAKVAELFPTITDHRRTMLESVADLKSGEDFQKYMEALEPYRIAFPPITTKEIQKLFPKNKKLKLPDLAQIDFRHVSYLSWIDIATNKMFIVYPAGGQFVGLEGRYTASNKKSYCFACNRLEEVVLFSAIHKKKPANASPDYYKTVGNYICINGDQCNKNVTDVAALEKFIESVHS
ncbi:FusB/FusC family EF-G-binding protein [Paenibacillus rhizovicinus]|uniref:FusB/FusC family EF-G-binding protein n=1 Tax=Paenibacillus rhizovicinus TaxID=2704463 RepID=A0A6C0P2Z2_9BACL|nr:FusB/FusC family EF-G-binding protein [Paenibacillus rhizovicinus]QHW32868.1 FusB/FusC family EF-G-binding protein [Paenibacillus rhizovicinus]